MFLSFFIQGFICLIYFFVFFFGAAIGSFLNCVICRLGTKKRAFSERSACPKCKHNLEFFDLIPVLSFLILRGKCRHCGKKISFQYPLVEIATGLVFILILSFHLPVVHFYQLVNIVFLLLCACFLIIIFVYDLKHYLIADEILFPGIFIALGYRLFESFQINNFLSVDFKFFFNYILAALTASGFFLIIFIFSRGKWIGFGDVKLGIFLGLFSGWPRIIAALFLAYMIGGIISTALLILKKKNMKSELPFAPFLITSAFIAMLWGEALIGWYLKLIQ